MFFFLDSRKIGACNGHIHAKVTALLHDLNLLPLTALVALLVIASCLLGIAMAALAFMMYLQYRSRQKSKMTYNYFDEDLEQKKPTAG